MLLCISSTANRQAKHPAIQKIQDIFREKAGRLYHWAEDRNIPADNNLAERELRPLIIARKISFGSQSDAGARIHDIKTLAEVVSLFIGHRRKMLKACAKLATGRLQGIRNWPVIFDECRIDMHLRPEELSTDSYISIANLCSEQLKNSI